MAAPFLQTNFNTQDPTTYRGAIDANFAVAAPIVDNFAPRAAATPNMTVLLDAGAISTVGGMPVQIAQQTSATLVAPAVNPRRDIVHIDSVSGVIGIATGAEAASPVDPTIPAGKIPIARVPMALLMTTIPNSIIVDLRAPVMASGGLKFAAIVANTTITAAQSGTTFKLSGVGVTATLPTPIGNAGTRYRFVGTDANTQTISTPAATLNAPDGTTSVALSITNNQALDIESDGSVWRVMGMEGNSVAQTPLTADNSTKVATTAFVKAALGLSSKVVTSTYDLALASGTVDITGFGFNPTACYVLGSIGVTFETSSSGFVGADASQYSINQRSAGGVELGSGSVMDYGPDNSNFVRFIASFITGGVRLTTTKFGLPTGILQYAVMGVK